MVNLIIEISKYAMILLFATYTYLCFSAFRRKNGAEKREGVYHVQNVLMYLIHFDAFLVICLVTGDGRMVGFYLMQVVFFTAVLIAYHVLYPNASRSVLNNMCMLLCIGFIILTRLSYERALRQFMIASISAAVCLIIPIMICKWKFLKSLTWFYAGIGLASLLAVAILGATTYGAKLSLSFGLFSLQPSEFVKVIFVFFIACMLHQRHDFRRVCITTVFAAAFVLVLVASNDLGGALIFYITYILLLYAATEKLRYFAGGLLAGTIAAVAAYQLFAHVQVRVLAWRDPLSVIDNEGYQICQSLFAIGTGGWFGMGLYQGMPNKIPVVEQDFIFSAISEEMGGIFAICLLMLCVSCFLMFFNISMQLKDQFYKLVALGLGVVYGFQVFLTIGGVTKFIPSTGVTLPFVSYGGSSMLSTMIIFAIIQGLYMVKQEEGGSDGEKENLTASKE